MGGGWVSFHATSQEASAQKGSGVLSALRYSMVPPISGSKPPQRSCLHESSISPWQPVGLEGSGWEAPKKNLERRKMAGAAFYWLFPSIAGKVARRKWQP